MVYTSNVGKIGAFRLVACTIRKEAKYSAEPAVALDAPMAVVRGTATTPRSRARNHWRAPKREGCQSDHRGTESRAPGPGVTIRWTTLCTRGSSAGFSPGK